MKILGSVISEELFINAFKICRNYCEKEKYIHDVNFRLLKESMLSLREDDVAQYYRNYIATDLVYSVHELFASDIVSIPKRLTGVREYRFFSTFSMILYNAIGLVFIDCCDQVISQLDFQRKKVFSYYPTKFNKKDNQWTAKNDYKTEYNAFTDKLNALIEPDDIILKIDIANYFETISHGNLIELLKKFATRSSLEKHGISNDSYGVFNFYFESVMQKKHGIPQGRKNFVSDYFGYAYLIPFDINIPRLAQSKHVKFKCSIRYVDDILVVCNSTSESSKDVIYRELLTIEQSISSWLYNNFSLSINTDKTIRQIIETPEKKKDFVKNIKKTISSPSSSNESEDTVLESQSSSSNISEQFHKFKSAISKFRFSNSFKFDFALETQDRENLKLILSKPLQGYVLKKDNINDLNEILKSLEFDLAAGQISVLIALFFLKKRKKSTPFYKHLEKFITKRINLSDKRHIHIMLAMLVQADIPANLLKLASDSSNTLINDNYGKYLLTLLNLSEPRNENSIYKRIDNEYKLSQSNGSFLHEPLSQYELIIDNLVSNYSNRQTLIQPLKQYIFERWNGRWDIAFNHLHNFFHELCKIRFDLKDSFSVINLVKEMDTIGMDDELVIIKFYDRRNFNAVSHPSQKGQPSVKVSKNDLEIYEKEILSIIVKHLID